MGAFDGIGNAAAALRAFQRELDITGNNIANVNTPGYSRQVADLAQGYPEDFWSNGQMQQVGTGVTVASVNRIRDMFLEAQQNSSQSDLGKYDALAGGLSQVESVMNDTSGTGIGNSLDQLFNAFSALASNPSDPGARTQVQLAASNLSQKIRSAYQQLDQIQSQFASAATGTKADIDGLTKSIADLNSAIRAKEAAGETPNSLLDQRDQAVNALSNLVNIKTTNNSDGTVTIVSGQISLVDSQGNRPFPSINAKTGVLTDANGTTYPAPTSGKLAGLLQAVSAMGNGVNGYKDQLDTLANTLRTQFNSVMKTGTNANGTTGIGLFNDSNPQTGAIDFDLSAAVKADPKNIATGMGAAGDGSLALKLAQLKTQTIAGLGSSSGSTISDYYTNMIGQVGRDSASFQSSLQTQTSVVQQVQSQIQSVSGVNLDDEMANMMRFQRSYQAAAKVLSVFDQTTQDVIGLIR